MRRRLGRVWQAIENSDIETADASESIEEHRERQQRLEIAAEEAHALLAKRRVVLDSADKITAFAEEMSEFLQTRRDHRDPGIRAAFRHADPGQARLGPRSTTRFRLRPTALSGAQTQPRALARGKLWARSTLGGPHWNRTNDLALIRGAL